MSHILHRHTRAELPNAVGGKGAYLFDGDGKRYLGISSEQIDETESKLSRAVQRTFEEATV